MSYTWNPSEENLLRSMYTANKSIAEIENAFNLLLGTEYFQVARTTRSIQEKIKGLKLKAVKNSQVEENLSVMTEIYNRYKLESEPLRELTNNKDRFILSLSDIHFPNSRDPRVLLEILNEYEDLLARDNSLIVLNGDILDVHSLSTFPKHKEVHLIDEYICAQSLIKLCLEYVPRIVMTSGNHEARTSKTARESIPASAQKMFRFNLMARLAAGEILDEHGTVIEVDQDIKKRVTYQLKDSWYVRVGKTIFAHPSGYANGPGATVGKVHNLMKDIYNFDDYDAIVCGHTHKLYKGIIEDKLLIEQGSLTGLLDYEGKASLSMGFSHNGYTIVWQDAQGNTNFNDSNFVYLGRNTPKKKKAL